MNIAHLLDRILVYLIYRSTINFISMPNDSIKQRVSPDRCENIDEPSGVGEDVRKHTTDALEAKEKRQLTPEQQIALLSALETRFSEEAQHYSQVEGVDFAEVRVALEANSAAMYSLAQMENTGGLPDIIAVEDSAFIFGDCSAESPDRRNLNYDQAAKMAQEFGVEMMPEATYNAMSGEFDMETCSWLATPVDVREAGNARHGCYYLDEREVDVVSAICSEDWWGWRGVLRVPKV